MNIRSREELTDYVCRGKKVKYVFFWGHKKRKAGISKSCFSQWYDSPYEYEGNHFMTAGHHMMYQKACLFGHAAAAQKILSA